MQTHHYIYNIEAEPTFKRIVMGLHELFDAKLLACGVGSPDMNIQHVKLSTMQVPRNHIARVIGGMIKFDPYAHSVLVGTDEQKEFECVFVYLYGENPHDEYQRVLDNTYMLQIAHKYPKPDKSMYQLWRLERADVESVCTMWSLDGV